MPPPTPPSERFGNADAAAELYGVTPRTVRQWARDGRTHAARIPGGRGWRFDLEQIVRDLASGNRAVKPTDLPYLTTTEGQP